jgi:heparinase II/III-like protein
MSPGELAWRMRGALRDVTLSARVMAGLEPRARTHRDTDPPTEPGFRVWDEPIGRLACTDTDEVAWRERLLSRAERLVQHRLSFFDLVDRHLGDPIDWNRDHASGVQAPLGLAPFLDYRDHRVTGDAKVVWEPNRHHHLVVLGRAYRVTGDPRYAAAVVEQIDSWISQCPFGRGMNWRSPLELAIRLINWVWAIDLVRGSGLVAGGFATRLRHAAYLHMWQITRSYSRGSSANNHRIGEAAGVFVGASYFRDLDGDGHWRRESRLILGEEIVAQTYGDGGTREQAVGYHMFVLQFFLVAGTVARATGEDFPAGYWSRIERMVEFLGALGEGGSRLPMIGDADDGYVLDLGGFNTLEGLLGVGAVLFSRSDFKSLARGSEEAAWWLLGPSSRARYAALSDAPLPETLGSRAFQESGYYLLQSGHKGSADRISVVFDCGELGFKSIAAHGHADALAFTVRAFGEDLLVDPGTYDYFTFPEWREYFRSTRAHNAVVVDDTDQSVMAGPFMWATRAGARCVAWEPAREGGTVVGEQDGYSRLANPVLHRRRLDLDAESRTLVIHDDILGPGPHDIAIYFHLAEGAVVSVQKPNAPTIAVAGGTATLEVDPRLSVDVLRGSERPIGGWVSRGYHRKQASTTLIGRARCSGDASFVTRLLLGS